MYKYSLYEKFKLKKIFLAKTILLQTQKHLTYYGRIGQEGLVYWSGTKSDGIADIKSCICPVQSNTGVTVDVAIDELLRLNQLLDEKNEVLIAQVHSHPSTAFHSSRDDNLPVTFTLGFFSLVVPHYCKNGLHSLSDLEVWEYVGHEEWGFLDRFEKMKRFEILSENKELT